MGEKGEKRGVKGLTNVGKKSIIYWLENCRGVEKCAGILPREPDTSGRKR